MGLTRTVKAEEGRWVWSVVVWCGLCGEVVTTEMKNVNLAFVWCC